MSIIVKIDGRSKAAKLFIEFVKTLPFAKIESSDKKFNSETEKSIADARSGKTFKVKNSKQLFKELGI